MSLRVENLVITLLFGLTAVGSVQTARVRPLWYDELFTLQLARSDRIGELTANLSAGVDLNPPVSYLLTSLSTRCFGESPRTIRLPSLIGGLVGMAGVYLFVRRRRSAAEALVAAAGIALPEPITFFFSEARPYGLMIGFTGLMLVCWQRAAEEEAARIGRLVFVAGFAASAALGVASHYYFVVPVMALGLAELVRTIARRNIDWAMFAGFLVPVVVFALLIPLWRGPRQAYGDSFWAKVTPSPVEIANVYYLFLDNVTVTVIVLAILVAAVASIKKQTIVPIGYRLWEFAAIVALALVPMIAFGMSLTITKVYVPRYCVPAVIGLATAFAFALGRTAGGNRTALLAITAMFCMAGFALQWKWAADRGRERARSTDAVIAFLNERATGESVVIELATVDRINYAIPAAGLTYRPVLVLDVELNRKYDKQDTVDRGTTALAALTGVPTVSFDVLAADVIAGRVQYYFGAATHWRAQELAARGITFEPIAASPLGPMWLYHVKKKV